jgi:hypothetical protein
MATAAFSTFLAAGDASMLQETRAGARALAGGTHWCALVCTGGTGGHLCAPVWGRYADGTQAARTRHWARVCRQRDLGPGVVLGQAYAGLNKLFTARRPPLVRLAPAAVSPPHTLTPSPTLLTSPPDLWACGLWAQFRARPLQPSLQAK